MNEIIHQCALGLYKAALVYSKDQGKIANIPFQNGVSAKPQNCLILYKQDTLHK